jgi:Lrp/AsnC family transcriptional regulator for asnA, asnC and gidA
MKTQANGGARSDSVVVTATDLAIIRCLQEDARSSLAKVSETLQIPESTVRHRFNRLVQQGLIEFALVNNPLKFGYSIWAIFEIQVQPAKIRAVAKALAGLADVHLVGIMTGNYDIYASALFRTNQDMVDFITGPLAKVSGIMHISTSNMLEVVKRNVTFGVPVGPQPISWDQPSDRPHGNRNE